MELDKELIDKLLAGYKSPEDLIGEQGLLKQLTRALVERAMHAELTHHLGCEKHDSAGRLSGNSRNGTSRPCEHTRPATVRRSAWPCAAACAAVACRPPESRRSCPAADPASAVAPASAAGNLAAKRTPASCRPSCARAQTPAPPPAGSSRQPAPPVAPSRTVPSSSCLRYPTENTTPMRSESASEPQKEHACP